MSKPQFKLAVSDSLAVSATFLFLIATSLLYVVSLLRTFLTLRDHFDNASENDLQIFPILTVPAKTLDLVPTRNISGKALKFPIPSRTINTTSHRTAIGRLFSPSPASPINPVEEVMLSMHQQLHCLNIIRIAYLDLHTTPSTMPPIDNADVDMCLEQIRQHIKCNCDLTLEPTLLYRMNTGVIAPRCNGIGVEHRCLNWEKLSAEIDAMAKP